MSGFFSMEGPFYKIGSIIADIMILSLVWIFFSIPLFTIGASTTALYYVLTRRISNREGYLLRDYWSSFKSNFKQSTLIWLLLVLVASILAINIRNIDLVGDIKNVILPVQICFAVELGLITIYIFPINARFEMKLKDSLKTAFFMANKHILTSIGCILVVAAVLLVTYLYFIFVLVAIGVYAYLTSFLFIRIFRKYRPEIDEDPALHDPPERGIGGYVPVETMSRELLEQKETNDTDTNMAQPD